MRAIVLALTLSCGCSSTDFAALKPKLKTYLTEVMRKQGFRDLRTDEDSRARLPTKYADATKGLAFTIRHSARFDNAPLTVSTWVFESAKARDRAKVPFQVILDDIHKEQREHKSWPIDIESPELHGMLLMESPSLSPTNQFQLLHRGILDQAADLKEAK